MTIIKLEIGDAVINKLVVLTKHLSDLQLINYVIVLPNSRLVRLYEEELVASKNGASLLPKIFNFANIDPLALPLDLAIIADFPIEISDHEHLLLIMKTIENHREFFPYLDRVGSKPKLARLVMEVFRLFDEVGFNSSDYQNRVMTFAHEIASKNLIFSKCLTELYHTYLSMMKKVNKVTKQQLLNLIADKINIQDLKNLIIVNYYSHNRAVNKFLDFAKINDHVVSISFDNMSNYENKIKGFINAKDYFEEASLIALLVKAKLDQKLQDVNIIVNNEDLASLIKKNLSELNIDCDDTLGRSIISNPEVMIYRLFFSLLLEEFKPSLWLSFLSSPYLDIEPREVFFLEKKVMRGSIPLKNFEDLLALSKLKIFHDFHELQLQLSRKNWENDQSKIIIKDFIDRYFKSQSFSNFILEKLAPFNEYFFSLIWHVHFKDLSAAISFWQESVSRISLHEPTLVPSYVKLLRIDEAIMLHSGVVIATDMNQETFSHHINKNVFLNSHIRKIFLFPTKEELLKNSYLQLATAFAADEIYFTRSSRNFQSPTSKASFLLRLELKLKKEKIYQQFEITEILQNTKNKYFPQTPLIHEDYSDPIVETKYRPTEYSATALMDLNRNPYVYFVKYILGLRPLNDFASIFRSDIRSIIIHEILAETLSSPHINPDVVILEVLAHYRLNHDIIYKKIDGDKIKRIVDFVLADLSETSENYPVKVLTEVTGEMNLGKFKIHAKADRVDLANNQYMFIIDYKLSDTPKDKGIIDILHLQLNLEYIIALNAGYGIIPKEILLFYIYFKTIKKSRAVKVIPDLEMKILELLNRFANENEPYCYRDNSDKDYEKDYLELYHRKG